MTDESERDEDSDVSVAAFVASGAVYAAVLAGVGALIVVGALWLQGSIEKSIRPTPAIMTISDRQALQEMRRDLTVIKAEQTSARLRGQIPPPVSALDARLTVIEKKQQQLERVIISDPNKALELPLMRRDLEALEQRQSVAIEAAQRSVEQVYDLSKWLLGALAVGILSLAISTLLRRRERAGEG